MIRRCEDRDFDSIFEVINDAAGAYKGVIPEDRYHEPHMPAEELRRQIDEGVEFWAYELDGRIAGVMGIQHVGDVTLIRHAYVRTPLRNKGIGGQLLGHLVSMTTRPCFSGPGRTHFGRCASTKRIGFRRFRRRRRTGCSESIGAILSARSRLQLC